MFDLVYVDRFTLWIEFFSNGKNFMNPHWRGTLTNKGFFYLSLPSNSPGTNRKGI